MRNPALIALIAATVFALGLGGCSIGPASANLAVPIERADECRDVCKDLEMELSAMVVMAGMAGCVCEPANTPTADSSAPGAGGVAGGATIATAAAAQAASSGAVAAQMVTMQQQRQRKRQQRKRQQQQR